jgi:hypothetical protein
MSKRSLTASAGLVLLLSATFVRAQQPAVQPAAAPARPLERLELGLELWLLYTDVDGPGGFSNREADPIRPKTRSPHLGIERAMLNVVGHVTPWLHVRTRFRANDGHAYVDRGYAEAELVEDKVSLQLGLNKPLQHLEKRTYTYSTLQASFWRNTQYHLAADLRWPGLIEPRLVPSVAFQRPLRDEFPSEDEAFGMISFGDADAGESNPVEYGGLASVSGFGVTLAGFGFVGQLSDNEDVLYLERLFSNYELAGNPTSRTSRWFGVRGDFERWGVFLHGERIWARQGLVDRVGLELAASYTVSLPLGKNTAEIEPIVRYSELAITNFPEEYAIPQTWDRRQWLFGALLRPLPMVELKLERVLLGERAGVSREGKTEVDNDEWIGLLQLEITNEDLE